MIQIRDAGRIFCALSEHCFSAEGPSDVGRCTLPAALVTNRHLNAHYQQAIESVPEGTPLHQAFGGIGLLQQLRAALGGGRRGVPDNLARVLIQVATVLEGDLATAQIERMVGLVTPILTLVIGGSIGGLIMQVMSAVLSINDLAFQMKRSAKTIPRFTLVESARGAHGHHGADPRGCDLCQAEDPRQPVWRRRRSRRCRDRWQLARAQAMDAIRRPWWAHRHTRTNQFGMARLHAWSLPAGNDGRDDGCRDRTDRRQRRMALLPGRSNRAGGRDRALIASEGGGPASP